MCGLVSLFTALVFGVGGFLFLGVQTPVRPEFPDPILRPTAEIAVPEMPAPLSCEPSDAEQDRATLVELGETVFEADTWSTDIRDVASKTVGQWDSFQLGAVAFAELLHYDCGVPVDAIDTYYSDDNLAIIQSNYAAWEVVDECERGDVRLWQFALDFEGALYEQRLWVEQISPTRVLSVSLTFPLTATEQMNRYAARLRPEFTVCGG